MWLEEMAVLLVREAEEDEAAHGILRTAAGADHSLNFSRYSVAAAKASSTFEVSVPLPMAVGALPPALPPTSFDTVADQSVGVMPALDPACAMISRSCSRGVQSYRANVATMHNLSVLAAGLVCSKDIDGLVLQL